METPVTNNDLSMLRAQGLVKDDEIAFIVGDKVIAENVVSKERRILETGKTILLEAGRQLLKG